jgi:alpha-glucosidase
MRKHIFYLFSFIFIAALLSCNNKLGNQHDLLSPDGKIQLKFELLQQKAHYSISFEQQELIKPSLLGFHFIDRAPLFDSLQVDSVSQSTTDEVWRPVWGTDASISNAYNQLIVYLSETDSLHRKFELVFRTFNDGIAFRYRLPAQDNLDQFRITSELTEFNFAQDFTAWWIKGEFGTYERLYKQTPLSQICSANTPITMKSENGIHISIHEAALTDYAGMTLKKKTVQKHSFHCELAPWPDGVKVIGQTPFVTPWRTFQIADEPGKLIESHLIENLNEPCKIEDTSWIKPMKYVGIWWGMHIGTNTWYIGEKHGATTAQALKYMNFAAANGIKGILIEGWNLGWDTWGTEENIQNFTTPYPDFDLPRLAAYAQKKELYLIGHHESGGNVPEYEKQLDNALDLYQSLGIHAVKTGYAGRMSPEGQYRHGQFMVRHYREVVKKMAEHQIMVDAHEPIKPTGIRRTWPNMMTREGVRGMEYNAWSDGNPPEHTTILPFTRMLAGPLDYTPGIFNIKFDPSGEHRVYTTLAKQLALYVVLYSPLQMAADLIENYEGQPAFKFIRDVPVNWDETKVLNAQIGDFVTIARRQGDSWYMGSITDEQPREMQIALDFLGKDRTYEVQMYRDAAETGYETNPTAIKIEQFKVDSEDTLKVRLIKSGGFAAIFNPQSGETK